MAIDQVTGIEQLVQNAPVAAAAPLATAAPIAADPFQYYTANKNYNLIPKLSTQQEKKLESLLQNWQKTGTLAPTDEDVLIGYGRTANQDFLRKYAPQGYTAPSGLAALNVAQDYPYLSPTQYKQSTGQIFGLTSAEEAQLDQLTQKFEAGQKLSTKEQTQLQNLLKYGNLGDYATYTTKKFAPTESNLFAGLTQPEEQEFATLADKYNKSLSKQATISKTEKAKLQNYLSKAYAGETLESYFKPLTYTAPTGYEKFFAPEKLTPELNTKDVVDKFYTISKTDPVRAAQYAKSMGLDEQEVGSLFKGYDPTKPYYNRPAFTMNEVKDIFAKGAKGLDDRVTGIFTATLGSDSEVQKIADEINKQKGTKLSVADVRNMYSVQKIQDKSLEDIQSMIEGSAFNKIQEANKLGGLFKNVFEFQNAGDVLKDVISSNPESKYDPKLKEIYSDMLKSQRITPEIQDKIYKVAAKTSPNAEIWKDKYDAKGNLLYNGSLLYAVHGNPITEPIKKQTVDKKTGKTTDVAGSGQYGYYNNAPILNADIANKLLKGKSETESGSKALGWNYGSEAGYQSKIKKGMSALGLNLDLNTIKKIDSGDLSPESADGYQQYDETEVTNLKKIGKQFGITKYSSLEDLYNKVNNVAKDFYMVTGQVNNYGWDKKATKYKNDHAGVLYRKFDNKLVPITKPTYFHYEKPKKSWISSTFGSTVGDIFEGLASVPFLPEIIGVAVPGVGPGIYAAMKGAQIAARPGSDINDILTGAGLAYLNAEIIPNYVTPTIAQGIGSLDIVKDLPKGWSDFVTKTGTSALVSSGIAALTNKDVGNALKASLTGSLMSMGKGSLLSTIKDTDTAKIFESTTKDIQNTANELVKKGSDNQFDFSKVPSQYKDLMANIIVDTMRGKGFEKALQSNVMKYAFNEAKKSKSAAEKQTTSVG